MPTSASQVPTSTAPVDVVVDQPNHFTNTRKTSDVNPKQVANFMGIAREKLKS